jgi:hypothetical protein
MLSDILVEFEVPYLPKDIIKLELFLVGLFLPFPDEIDSFVESVQLVPHDV